MLALLPWVFSNAESQSRRVRRGFQAAFGRGGLEDTSSSLKTISTSVGSGQKIFSHKDHKVHIALCDSLCSMWLIKIATSVGFF